ncbi:hypothetical protein [Candidatus Oleimmundimicrobium sp.]|uniref:hypothetical protein n=1 Tax=Candidatus Oleimmundimicrobium sp. TaxID=3060597 RepID=UPI00271DEEB1|nr:hypothetical protein [Candidatus Oleimmundimicrobium sp.]MDO8886124.1 hypothetical protein [Candidatus Oleimmundimicrobium sp.]
MSSRCENCRWYVEAIGSCVLGRKEEKCDSPKARRGDDGLAVRLLDVYKEGRIEYETLRKENKNFKEKEK